jgi:kinesin family protein 5
MSGNNIKVVCRFRPQNSLEIREGGTPIISIDGAGENVALKVTMVYSSFIQDDV